MSLIFKTFFSLLLVLLSTLLNSCLSYPHYSDSVNEITANTNSAPVIASNSQSRVCSLMYKVEYKNEDIKEFNISQHLPEIWIVEKVNNEDREIDCDANRIKLSSAAQDLLQTHWIDRNEHNYNTIILKLRGSEGVKADTKLANSFINTINNLQKLPVSDQKNARKITITEAENMVILIRDYSKDVLQAIENSKK